jgi:hypothetical protein
MRVVNGVQRVLEKLKDETSRLIAKFKELKSEMESYQGLIS